MNPPPDLNTVGSAGSGPVVAYADPVEDGSALDLDQLLEAMQAVRSGNFTARLPGSLVGLLTGYATFRYGFPRAAPDLR